MTSLRNLWISEMWRTVPEWHQTKDEAADARERNALLNRSVETAPETVEKGAA